MIQKVDSEHLDVKHQKSVVEGVPLKRPPGDISQ